MPFTTAVALGWRQYRDQPGPRQPVMQELPVGIEARPEKAGDHGQKQPHAQHRADAAGEKQQDQANAGWTEKAQGQNETHKRARDTQLVAVLVNNTESPCFHRQGLATVLPEPDEIGGSHDKKINLHQQVRCSLQRDSLEACQRKRRNQDQCQNQQTFVGDRGQPSPNAWNRQRSR